MPIHFRKKFKALHLFVLAGLMFLSCNKAVVNFGEEALTDDPNIVYTDTMTVNLATYQMDSFNTAGDTIFITGIHTDSLLGKYEAKAFMQIGIPTTNNLNGCTNCTFDSLVFSSRFSGSYMGDTTEAFTVNVHRLNQQMIGEETSIGYNTSSFAFDATPLGIATLSNPRPSAKGLVSVKLDNQYGYELFEMLKRNSDTITDATLFYKYFNGIAFTGSGTNQRSIYYFNPAESGSNIVMKLYYRQNGSAPVQASIDFPIAPSNFQFNAFNYDRSGTPLSAFIPKKRQIISSAVTENMAFLHGNSGLFPHITIPALLSIKELYPYIKVVKAELEITPSLSNYASGTGYQLPPAMALYQIDENKNLGGVLYDASGSVVQTGNLVIDYLYHKDTRYTYDLTGYVNNILDNGIFSQKSLVLLPFSKTYENRLILNNAINNKSVKLKLYVLGL
jgi:hypothetical protein